MTGRKPQEAINPVEFPEALHQLWLWFLELNASRSSGMGACPISYSDMQAYFSLMQCRPEPWEISAIRRLDGVALESIRG